ncbi:MAG: S8 family serine peptidase, partial [Candidatus Kapaibacterium sp.]
MKADLSKYGKFIAAWALLLMISFMPAIAESYIIKIRPGSDAKQKLQSQFPEMINVFDNLLSDRIKINRDSPLSAVQNRALDKLSGYYIIETVPGRSIQDIISEITSTDGVISIEPNYLYHTEQIGLAPNDSAYKYQWGLGAINIEEAWQRASGDGVLVGVVDTGIDWEHPDLKNNLYINPQEDINGNGRFDPWSSSESRDGVAGDLNGIDDDGNGYPDDVIGYDFVNQDVRNLGDASGRDPLPADEHSHGTIVSGVIAAERNNKIGIAGIAYNSKILTARGLDANGAGEADDIAQAIVYCALQGADVINFSFGEPYVSSIMQDAIDFAASMGCVMVSSSGNNGWDRRHFPSDHDNVISVGAVNSDGLRDWRSNYGSHLDLTAPGVNIITTNLGGGYRPATGTSLAAPHVSGAAALLLQNNPDFTPQEVRGLLRASARDAGENGWDQYFASGILDAAKLLEFRGITEIVIDYPKNEDEFSRDLSTEIPIIGTIATPLLDKIEIYIGEGINPRPASDKLDPWSFINEGFTVKNDTIAKISTAGLRDTVYTVRVLAYLKNNNTIEERINIYLYSDNSSNEFVSFRQFEALNREKRLPAVAAATSMRSQLSIMYRPENSTDEYHSASEKEFMTRNHLLLLDRAEPGIAYEAIAVARLQNGDTISRSFTFALPDEKVVTGQFARKDYSLPPGYLCPQVADLYQPGQPVIALNELTNYFWNNIKTFEFADGDFTEKDESYESWIPAG